MESSCKISLTAKSEDSLKAPQVCQNHKRNANWMRRAGEDATALSCKRRIVLEEDARFLLPDRHFLKAAYYKVARNEAQVINHLARRLAETTGS